MKKLFIWIFKAVALFMLAMFIYVIWGLWDATNKSSRVAKEICAFARNGKTVDEIKAFATARGCVISSSFIHNEHRLSIKPKSGADLRYYQCYVYYDGQKVKSAKVSTYDPK